MMSSRASSRPPSNAQSRHRHCKLCSIILYREGPPTPCFRTGCRFARGRAQVEPVSPVQSTLSGGDFSETR